MTEESKWDFSGYRGVKTAFFIDCKIESIFLYIIYMVQFYDSAQSINMRNSTPKIFSIEGYRNAMDILVSNPDKYDMDCPQFEWDINSDHADDPEIRKLFGSNVRILDDLKKLSYKRVYIEDGGEEYTLIGVQITNEDFYYILRDDNSNIYTPTCCTKIIPVDDNTRKTDL